MFTPRVLRVGLAVVGCAALIACLGACSQSQAPTVVSTDPAAGATGVSVNKAIVVTFSERMDPATITGNTFTLMRGATPVAGTVTTSGVTATFKPTSDLALNTLYTAKVSAGVQSLGEKSSEEMSKCELCPEHVLGITVLAAGAIVAAAVIGCDPEPDNALANDFVWTFTTTASPDTTAPTVISTIPATGATGVALGANISAVFSEAMNPSTISTSTFTLMRGTTPVSGTVTAVGINALFNPANALLANTLYTATISTGVRDLAGNALVSNYVWTFTTSATADTTAPTVISTFPANGATGVPLGANISAVFSEAMNPLTITTATFTLMRGTTPVSGTVTAAGINALFNPATALLANTQYTATIMTGVEDLSGNAMATNYVWSFTTGATADTTAPTVIFTFPANGDTGVPIGGNLSVTFSEAMNPLTVTMATFTLRQGATPIVGTVTAAGINATFNPVNTLLVNTVYTATISTGAQDLAGNALASNFVWTFTTGANLDTIAPMVSAVYPAQGTTDVPPDGRLAVVFSEVMDPLTVNNATFTLRQGATLVPSDVIIGTTIALLTPSSTLLSNTLYTATITTGVRDLAGNALESNFVWTFTTGENLDTIAPMVSAVYPAQGTTDVPPGGRLAAVFSEVMDPLTVNNATFILRQGATVVPSVVLAGTTIALLTPSSTLLSNTLYTATITTGVQDLAGNALESNYVWSFTTGTEADTTAPTVISTFPANEATGVPIGGNLSVTFSEAMNPLTVTSATFTLRQGATPVAGTVTSAGATAVFNPIGALLANTVYTATINTGARDLADNALASNYVWTFTTGAVADTTAPTVISTLPANGATGVPLGGYLAATFSEVMNPLTVTTATFTLRQGATLLPGTVYIAGATAVFNPISALLANTVYTATISTGARDLAGNALASNYVWTFTTGVTTAQGQINLGTAGDFAILAGSTVANTGLSTITGDLGVSPGTAVTGFPPGILNGTQYTGVASAAGQAKLDLTAAFNDAAGRTTGSVSLPGDLSGLTLYPGLYTNATSVMLSAGNVTLDAQGDANAVFILQMGSTLTMGSGTQVILSGGAKAANIYWQVGSSATLGTTSIVKGNILAQESITLATGATLEGRALTQTAAVTLDAAVIAVPAL